MLTIFRVIDGEVAPLSEPIEPKDLKPEDNTVQLSQSMERRRAIRRKLIGMSKVCDCPREWSSNSSDSFLFEDDEDDDYVAGRKRSYSRNQVAVFV